jgi:hypothetical protein
MPKPKLTGLSPRNRALVRSRRVRVLPFSKLPEPYYNAITVYHENADAPLPQPSRKFGIATASMTDLIDAIMDDDELVDAFDSWAAYHAWYMKRGGVPHHKTRWPVILSRFDDETLEDGWHRLHSYYRDGDDTVPVIWYA